MDSLDCVYMVKSMAGVRGTVIYPQLTEDEHVAAMQRDKVNRGGTYFAS